MTRALRKIHFFAFVAIAGVIAVALPAVLLNRPTPPEPADLRMLTTQPADGLRLTLPGAVGSAFPAQLELRQSGARFLLRLTPRPHPALASVLAYWSPLESPEARDLPESAWLLGEWSPPDGSALEFPDEAAAQPGMLWLRSLSHRQVVGRLELPPLRSLQPAEAQ